MSTNSFFAKFLRFIGIVLMALTGGFTLLGGIGHHLRGAHPDQASDSMAPLAPFQWLYILFVLAGIAIGVMGHPRHHQAHQRHGQIHTDAAC